MTKVGVIGGGITGLTAAYELAKRGHKVVVVEQDPKLGGQAGTFSIDGALLEKYYHHLFKSDEHIIGLINELGIGNKLLWLDARTGVFHGGGIYPFVSPIDLIRFDPLSLVDRVRLGLQYLYLQRFKDWKKLESVTAKDWVIRNSSRRIYDVLWGPLLRGKFAESAEEVSMTWLWGKVHLRGSSRSKDFSKEQLGYLDGSFQVVIDALADSIRAHGGEILTSARAKQVLVEQGKVRGFEVEADGQSEAGLPPLVLCDRVIATIPSHAFLRIAPELPGDYADKLRRVRYQSAVCVILELDRSLSKIYWLNISDDSIPFVGAIEHTNLVPPDNYAGKRIVYLANYLSPSHPLFGLSDGELLRAYIPHLRKINPSFDESWITGYRVYRDVGGQPVVTTNYSAQLPSYETPIPGLYLANTTQIYPEDRGTNYSVRLGRTIGGIVGSL
ncbi:MAG: NAD(P)/FAD-dependent oxidoreductase [Dehalococcoidales bacterium]|nr:NAD(P)/FAD-dependent oxidoreductase [Dehalococcoidales bacterium]